MPTLRYLREVSRPSGRAATPLGLFLRVGALLLVVGCQLGGGGTGARQVAKPLSAGLANHKTLTIKVISKVPESEETTLQLEGVRVITVFDGLLVTQIEGRDATGREA